MSGSKEDVSSHYKQSGEADQLLVQPEFSSVGDFGLQPHQGAGVGNHCCGKKNDDAFQHRNCWSCCAHFPTPSEKFKNHIATFALAILADPVFAFVFGFFIGVFAVVQGGE